MTCGKCSACGQLMDNAGFGYCQCMNPECEKMGIKVKAKEDKEKKEKTPKQPPPQPPPPPEGSDKSTRGSRSFSKSELNKGYRKL